METHHPSRQRIIDSARELIYANNYTDVGVASICAHAGVKKGSFYHFFDSKRELTKEVLGEIAADFERDMFIPAFSSERSPMQRVEHLNTLLYQFHAQIQQETGQVLGCPFGNLANELSTTEEAIRHKLEQIFKHLRDLLAAQLQQAQELGEIEHIDSQATADAMLAYFEGVLLLAKTRNDSDIIKALLPAMTQIRIQP